MNNVVTRKKAAGVTGRSRSRVRTMNRINQIKKEIEDLQLELEAITMKASGKSTDPEAYRRLSRRHTALYSQLGPRDPRKSKKKRRSK